MRSNVDIIIPYHGQYELVTRCLGSIFSCTPNQKYTIYLVDDCSPNTSYLQTIAAYNKKVFPIRLDEQSGFGAALAAGFTAGKSESVVFMHSDIYIDNINWLFNFQVAYDRLRDQNVKLLSARSNSAGTSSSYDERLIGDKTDEMEDIIVDSPLPLQCAFCRRELFERIGGFVKPYPYAWYEDEELYWRMKYYGFRQAIVGNNFVYHDGGATINGLLKSSRTKNLMEENRQTCLDDVKPYLRQKRSQ